MMTQASLRARPVASPGGNASPRPTPPSLGVRPLRIIAAAAAPAACQHYLSLLHCLGHQACAAGTSSQLLQLLGQLQPDLVIADAGLLEPGPDARTMLQDYPTPVILIHSDNQTEFGGQDLEGIACAALTRPVTAASLSCAIAVAEDVFRQMQALRQEVANLRQQLEERKLIERAKGALVRRLGVQEDVAFRRLRKQASDRNLKLVDIARRVLEAEDVFRQLDGTGGPSSLLEKG